MNIRFFRIAAAALTACTVCAGQTAPSKEALVKLETSAYAAWKSKDAKFWDSFLWDRFIGNGPSGPLDKAVAAQEYSGTDCDIRSFALSDVQTAPLGNDAALITYRESVHGTCGGRQLPANSWAASIYVRAGDQWKAAFHAASPVVDPKTDHTQDQQQPSRVSEPQPAARDAGTDTLLAVEKTVWEAWRDTISRSWWS